jgi:hypothetical protein
MVAQRIPGTPITIETVIHEDRKLTIDLPPDVPIGQVEVEVIVRPVTHVDEETALAAWRAEYERLRAKLAAAGALSTIWKAPEGAVELSEEERIRIGTMPPGAPPSEQLVREDRGEY